MTYKYIITYEDGKETVIDIPLDERTMNLPEKQGSDFPDWTRLDFCKCPVCPYDSASKPFCPVAVNLSEVTRLFSDKASTMMVDTRVITKQREYFKRASLQSALSSIIGIYMSTSGCKLMDILKPMARHHLPFATLEETVYRSVSSYLLLQYLLKRKGQDPDWDLEKLRKSYSDIESLNSAMTDRVRKASEKDANYNAVIILDAFAKMVPWSISQGLPDKDLPATT
jgi:hypothetical protein